MKELLIRLLSLKTTCLEEDNLEESICLIKDYIVKNCSKEISWNKYCSGGKPSLVVIPKKKKDIKIFFVGHLDVVPGVYDDAFTPYEREGRIYARGASDMKGPNVAMIEAFIALLEEDLENIGMIFTTDEEVGGFDGVKYLLNEEGYSCKVAFIPDGGDNWQICTDQKAVYHTTLKAKGVSAHGSRPWQGDNANLKLLKSYNLISQSFIDSWGVFSKKDSWKPTINLGVIEGGETVNKVADRAIMKLDIRFPASVDREEIEEIVKDTCKICDCNFEVDVYGNAFHTSRENKYLNLWYRNIETKSDCKEDSIWKREHGASDARFFSEKGIPCVISKPICSEVHIDDEWIDYNSLIEFKNSIVDWVKTVYKI